MLTDMEIIVNNDLRLGADPILISAMSQVFIEERHPAPKFVVFYNGTENEPDEMILRYMSTTGVLSARTEGTAKLTAKAYGKKITIAVTVTP